MAASNDNTITLISDGAAAIPQFSMVSTDAAGNIGLTALGTDRTMGIVQEGLGATAAPATPLAAQPVAVQVFGVSYALTGFAGIGAAAGAVALMVEAGTGALIAHVPGNVHCANWLPSATQAAIGAFSGDIIRVLIVAGPAI